MSASNRRVTVSFIGEPKLRRATEIFRAVAPRLQVWRGDDYSCDPATDRVDLVFDFLEPVTVQEAWNKLFKANIWGVRVSVAKTIEWPGGPP